MEQVTSPALFCQGQSSRGRDIPKVSTAMTARRERVTLQFLLVMYLSSQENIHSLSMPMAHRCQMLIVHRDTSRNIHISHSSLSIKPPIPHPLCLHSHFKLIWEFAKFARSWNILGKILRDVLVKNLMRSYNVSKLLRPGQPLHMDTHLAPIPVI